jgi:prevent-host-death family protein
MDNVYGILGLMKTVPAGEFKQTCLRLLDEVQETHEPLVITKRGRPVAQLVPLDPSLVDDWAGAMAGTGRIVGDLVESATDPAEWEALRP